MVFWLTDSISDLLSFACTKTYGFTSDTSKKFEMVLNSPQSLLNSNNVARDGYMTCCDLSKGGCWYVKQYLLAVNSFVVLRSESSHDTFFFAIYFALVHGFVPWRMFICFNFFLTTFLYFYYLYPLGLTLWFKWFTFMSLNILYSILF